MSKVIVGIHGLGNKPSQKILLKWWRSSILEGLRGIGIFIFRPKVIMIYWADILYNKPLDANITDKNDIYYLEEKYIPAPKKITPTPHPLRKKILSFVERQLDKIFLNDDLSINFSFISDMIIHRYFKELETYYQNSGQAGNPNKISAKEKIRNRAAKILAKHKKDEIFFVAHSMGSIIAFDVLTFILPGQKINTFATIGSPLGIPVVMSKIASEQHLKPHNKNKLKTPPGITRAWYNFSDLEDKIAFNYNLSDDYNSNDLGVSAKDFVVNNNFEIDGIKNPHKSYGYLRTPEFSETLYQFLISGHSNFYIKIIIALNNLIKFFYKLFTRQN